jgi:hypothetical protein
MTKPPFPTIDAPYFVRDWPRQHRVDAREQVDGAHAFFVLARLDREWLSAAVAFQVHIFGELYTLLPPVKA